MPIRQCPFCGFEGCEVDGRFDVCAVECLQCWARGPESTYDECIEMWNGVPRKIKMTKELPAEEGYYYWAENQDEVPDILEVEYQSSSSGYMYEFITHEPKELCALIGETCRTVEYLGGYWAKVDKDQFEFEQ